MRKYNFLFLLLISIVFSFVTNVKAQHYNFIRYDVKDGLALSQISRLDNLSDGKLLITTFGGGFDLYDGRTFANINSTDGLAHNNIYSIAKTSDSLIWFGTERGLSSFDGKSITNFTKNDGLPAELIWSLSVSSDSTLWIGTPKGLAKFEKGKISTIENKLVKGKDIWSLFSDSKGNVWIGTMKSLIIYNIDKGEFEAPEEYSDINTVHSFSEDKNGIIWAGTDYGLFKIQDKSIQNFGLKSGLTHDLIWSTYVDSKNNLWLGTNQGVTLFRNGEFIQFTANQGLTDYKIWAIQEDFENNIWIGSDEGLYKLNDINFKIYKEVNGKPIDAWTIVEKGKDDYLISSELQGIIQFKNGKFTDIKIGDADIYGISTIFIDRDNNTWVASDKGIYKYSNFNFNKSTISYKQNTGPITHIMQDKAGNIKFASYYDGTIEFNGKEFFKYKTGLSDPPIIYDYLLDQKEKLWAATSFGIMIVTRDSMYVPGGFEHLTNYSIENLVQDSYGTIWAGSYEIGLISFDPIDLENIEFDTVSVKHGLSNQSIMATTTDGDNNLWISTNFGFNRFDIDEYHKTGKKIILSYNLDDGIPGVEGYQNGILTDSKNNVIIGTIDGLVVFDPQKVKVNKTEPIVKFTKLKIVNKEFNEKIISGNKLENYINNPLELSYDHNNLTIEFVGICLTNPSTVEYSFQLNNDDWSNPSLDSKAYLPNLDYGEYTLKVKAANNNGVWSTKPASLKFELIAPFWQKVWFQFLMAIAFLGLAFLFYLYRMNRMERINKELEERIAERIKYENKLKKSERELRAAKELAENSDKLKSEFLAQMSHEIRTPINSILSYTSLIKEDIKEHIDASLKEGFSIIENSSRRLIKTIDSILNMSQLQTGSFDFKKKNLNLTSLLSDLHQEFQNIASEKYLKLELNMPEKDCFVYADHYTTAQMLANLIDNAIKYTNRGKIAIDLKEPSPTKFVVKIIDSGIGISKEFQKRIFDPFTQEQQGYTRKYDGSGLGLSLVLKYAKLNEVDLTFESKKDEGTTFILVFPHQNSKSI